MHKLVADMPARTPDVETTEVRIKAPAPGLDARAPRPRAVRLRGGAVKAAAGLGALLVAGALAWAFVVQPELRSAAQARSAEGGEETANRVVRPAEIVTGQPDRYDRLPEPRTGGDSSAAEGEVAGRPATEAGAYTSRPVRVASGPGPRELASRSGLFFEAPPSPRVAPPSPSPLRPGNDISPAALPPGYSEHRLHAPVSPYELKAGTTIPAAMVTAVDTSRAGPVVGMVVEDVYDSVSGEHLLVPRGSRLVGKTEGRGAYGDRRAFLTWERLILPNGKSIVLTEAPGVDGEGAVGVKGQVDRRLVPLLTGTLFAGAITSLGQMARDDAGQGSSGWLGGAGDAAAIQGAQVGGRLVDRELEVRPTIRLPAGVRVGVMITRDMVLEPYR